MEVAGSKAMAGGEIMIINFEKREIYLKIVYYGPGMSGKTTNLKYIYAKIAPGLKGEFISLQTQEDRTIFFDFLQIAVGKINGLTPKFNLYTVPGQEFYAYSRRIILTGVDGAVFVADSRFCRLEADVNALQDLQINLGQRNRGLDEFPWVIQYNKRDLPAIAPMPYLQLKLNPWNAPSCEAVATTGAGVFETLKAIINLVIANLQKKI
jgi:mutual gliding-motility protein MglA